MQAFRGVLLFAGLVAAPAVSAAQKTIRISDSLAHSAERLKVERGAQWMGHIGKWRFGDYAVVSGKPGWTHSRTTGNFFQTESESRTHETFTFVMTNAATDSAIVNAARHVNVQELHKLDLGHGWSLGSDELVQESENFTALITINRDTTKTWVLLLGSTSGRDSEGKHVAFLTNGERRILLSLASSNKDVYDFRGWPALGYEFVENGQSLCALQYFGGSFDFTQVVWMHSNLDPRTKLILAAAMTAVLQVRSP